MKSYTVTVDTDEGPVTGHYTPGERGTREYPESAPELETECTDPDVRMRLWEAGMEAASEFSGRRQASEECGDDDR